MILALLFLVSTPSHYEKGITISCRGSGQTWETDAFAEELGQLVKDGVTAISIHPYARIERDGTVRFHYRGQDRTTIVERPIREAQSRGIRIMIKPHLAYWGNFSWRGEIRFEDEALQQFQKTYREWILQMAQRSQNADYFVVGTELKQLTADETYWRNLIKEVRSHTKARLTYAANWDHYQNIAFWDALDVVGIQAYFPISDKSIPSREDLQKGWQNHLQTLKKFSQKQKRSILFTELGYNNSLNAAAEPWSYQQNGGKAAEALQALLLDVSLTETAKQSNWFNGVFLWKWFVGNTHGEDFLLNDSHMKNVLHSRWR